MRRSWTALAVAVSVLAVPAVCSAQPVAAPYGANSAEGFWDVVPPGENGHVDGPALAAFTAAGTRPSHSDDQVALYDGLLLASPGLQPSRIEDFFKDSRFGVKPGAVARTYSPRADVTIVRDSRYGIPSIYGATRAGALFGSGYASAEDHLFTMDVLRHAGRAQLSSFAGGSAGNRHTDEGQWAVAPYTEQDLLTQYDRLDDLYGEAGAVLQRDLVNLAAGVNAYIAEARVDPRKMPGEYAAITRPQGPDPWTVTDPIAIGSLIGGVLGKGGGGEVRDAELLASFRKRFGRRLGERLFRDMKSVEEPEAPLTVKRGRFSYTQVPRRRLYAALPDADSVEEHRLVRDGTGSAATPAGSAGGREGGLLNGVRLPDSMSNALLVSARESESGRPIMVAGPQAGYWSPNVFWEFDIHAPASGEGPAIDARGTSFVGTSLFVELGHGRDYAWSATSAGQDVIDTFAVELCEPDGSAPAKTSMHYRFRGECLPIEEVRRRNAWQPSAADMTAAGSESLVAERTKLGLVSARATRGGKPVAYVALRSTYFHELDSAIGFVELNDPNAITGPEAFKRAASKIAYTFNWMYADAEHIAFQNGGANPVRSRRLDSHLPLEARPETEWRNWNPDLNTFDQTPPSAHPNTTDQAYIADWNNKQASRYGQPDFGDKTSLYRSRMLEDNIRRGIRGRRKMSLAELVDAMTEAATSDFRGTHVLPWALRAIGAPRDPDVRAAVEKLRSWSRSGAHRIDRDGDNDYEDAEAVQIMDAWWPLWMEAQFGPTLGKDLYAEVTAARAVDDGHRRNHDGSAFQNGFYGYAHKDLRAVLGRRVEGRYARVFCGRGKLRRCRIALRRSLKAALAVPASEIYDDARCARIGMPGSQWCADAIFFTTTGGVSHPPIAWQNRPTYQQAVEVGSRVPR